MSRPDLNNHRDHLPALGAATVTFGPPTTTPDGIDFIQAMASAYGTDPLKHIDMCPNRFNLRAGNEEPDRVMHFTDLSVYLSQTETDLPAYLAGDYDMDGKASGLDFNLYVANPTAGQRLGLP